MAMGAAAVGAVIALAGCQPNASTQASSSATASTAASSGSSAAVPTSGSVTTSATARATSSVGPTCATGQVGVDIGAVQPASGSRRMTLVFINTSSSSCSLVGFPGVAVTGKTGALLLDGKRNGNAYGPVRIAPGGRASATLMWEGFPADGSQPNTGNCPGMADGSLLVTPPDASGSAAFPVPTDVCWGLSVGPVVSGVPTGTNTSTGKPSCPVSAQTLTTAIATDAHASQAFAEPLGLRNITCDQGFATALTAAAPGVQSMAVLFGYQADATGAVSWRVLEYGSSMTCARVPSALVGHMPYCHP